MPLLKQKDFNKGYNIICPYWELENYPQEYAESLNLFDEIWVFSDFNVKSIKPSVNRPVFKMPQPCEVKITERLSRPYFNIPQNDYVFLFFFDFNSYIERKNPHAVIDCFQRVLKIKPTANTKLIIKLNAPNKRARKVKEFKHYLSSVHLDNLIVVDEIMNDNEIFNLINCCDCFISLHRSEGFGRGPAEAMYLGKPVIATAYSGNMDYMNQQNSFLVDYELIPLKENDYLHTENQIWASPNLEQASQHMLLLLENSEIGKKIGEKARKEVQKKYSYISAGREFSNRLRTLMQKF